MAHAGGSRRSAVGLAVSAVLLGLVVITILARRGRELSPPSPPAESTVGTVDDRTSRPTLVPPRRVASHSEETAARAEREARATVLAAIRADIQARRWASARERLDSLA